MAAAKPAESLAPSSADGPPAGSGSGPGSVAGMRLAAKIGERSRLAAAFRRARFLIDPGTVRAWAVLAAAETSRRCSPRGGRRGTGPADRGRRGRDRIQGAGRDSCPASPAGHADRAPDRGSAWSPPPAAEPTPSPAGEPDARAPAGRAPGADAPDRRRAVRPRPHAAAGRLPSGADPTRRGHAQPPATGEWPTRWGGLLFLLATADQAGIPREVLADDAFADRLLSWVLFHLGTLLVPAGQAGVPDPAMFALAGLLPADRPAAPAPTALSGHGSASTRGAGRTPRPLGSAPAAPMIRSRRSPGWRPGTASWPPPQVVRDPPAAGQRRYRRAPAGLDVDPGWVPWLGSVVMFRYA